MSKNQFMGFYEVEQAQFVVIIIILTVTFWLLKKFRKKYEVRFFEKLNCNFLRRKK